MEVSVWGVRGGIAAPGESTAVHGGNTPCVAVQSRSGRWLILDAGTGIRALGERLVREIDGKAEIDLLLSHFHWDHLQGLPFFAPMWDARFTLRVYVAADTKTTESCVRQQMDRPFFPVTMDAAPARVEYVQIRILESQRIADLEVVAFPQHHPQGSTGFRVEEGRAAVVYATDSEGGMAATDEYLLRHASGADLLILDAQYTPEEGRLRAGWGHGDFERACAVAAGARVDRLLLFHHDPRRTDRELEAMEAQAQRRFAGARAAREGMAFHIL